MTNTTKTVMIAIILIATALSGCIGDTAKEDEMIERMAQLEVILTDPEISEEEKIAAYTLAHEAITGEKVELNSEVNVTPIHVPRTYLNCGFGDKVTDPINGVGYFKTWIGGVGEPDNTTVSGFTDPSLDRIKIVEVFLNNESVDKYVPIKGESRKVTTTIVGDWNVKIVATLYDGTILSFSSSLGGMKDMSNHPSYKGGEITITGSGPFDARYIETDDGAMTRAEAKALCDELGIVWGDERDS